MSQFECPVVAVRIESHPNADSLELAYVGDYISIVKKGQFVTGQLAVYLPEQAVLPEWLLKKLGFWDDLNGKGTLTSSAGNRIKAIKLRGILSQGILLGTKVNKWHETVVTNGEGDDMVIGGTDPEDCAEFLGVTKWEPHIPVHMAGKVAGGDLDATISYDFENIKKCPQLFKDGIEVVITEKIHGTCLQVGIIPHNIWEGKSWADKCPDVGDGFKGVVTSKGQGAKGLMLDPGDIDNLYVGIATKLGLWERLEFIRNEVLGHPDDMPLFIFGEIFGINVQDLGYAQPEAAFNAFDMYAGTRSNGFYLDDGLFQRAVTFAGIPAVPELYRGPFSKEVVLQHTNGNTVVTSQKQIREGVVVKATKDTKHPKWGRRIAKSISEAYLMRKGETTELQ